MNNRFSAHKIAVALSGAVLTAASLIIGGCNTTGCTENRSSVPLVSFYSSSTSKTIQLDSLDIGGVNAPNDSMLLHAGTKADQIYLPLRQTAENASFYIAYKWKNLDFPELIDTIKFSYQSIPYFVSEECGAMLRYRLTTISHTTHLIDSVTVVAPDSIITNVEIESLRIYFKTTGEDES